MQLYDRHFPADWMHRMGEPEVWQDMHNVDPGELWETHNALKNLLLAFVRRRVSRQCRRRGESDDAVEAARNVLDPNVLTIGFARRFATYKRADLILPRPRPPGRRWSTTRSGRCSSSSPARPIPADEPGKQLIQKIANLRHDPRFAGRDRVHRRLRHQRLPAPGAGRRRVAEQPAAAAGGLRHQRAEGRAQRRARTCSILDGWWAEAYNGKNGFAIGNGTTARRRRDHRRAATREDLFRVLEEEVIPLYYDRDVDGLPRQWIKRMMNSIATLAWRFSAHRMVMDYVRSAYVPAAGGLSCEMKG